MLALSWHLYTWNTWRETALIGGGGKCHAAAKAKPKWSPYVITTPSGRLSTRPADQLEHEAEQLESFWKARVRSPVIHVDDRAALPRAAPSEIEAAARAFPKRTCHGASDGLHPRHWALIEEEGRIATAILFEAIETIGVPPYQLQQLLVTLIDKPAGGFRPIVLFAPLQRLWARLRRSFAVDWIDAHDRPYWASGKGYPRRTMCGGRARAMKLPMRSNWNLPLRWLICASISSPSTWTG